MKPSPAARTFLSCSFLRAHALSLARPRFRWIDKIDTLADTLKSGAPCALNVLLCSLAETTVGKAQTQHGESKDKTTPRLYLSVHLGCVVLHLISGRTVSVENVPQVSELFLGHAESEVPCHSCLKGGLVHLFRAFHVQC
eukprot:1108321-Rhodomonas_salina.1